MAVVCTTNRYHVGGRSPGWSEPGWSCRTTPATTWRSPQNGSFSFATTVASGATFTVSVKTQPSGPAQTCQLSAASGTVGAADVTGVVVNCGTNAFTVGGTITGLAGTGLVLQNNGGNDLAVAGGGTFAFTTPVTSGGAFAVTVKTQPSAPMQTCAVSQGTGTRRERQRHQRGDHLRHQDLRRRRHRHRPGRQRAGPSEQPGRQPDGRRQRRASPSRPRSRAAPVRRHRPHPAVVAGADLHDRERQRARRRRRRHQRRHHLRDEQLHGRRHGGRPDRLGADPQQQRRRRPARHGVTARSTFTQALPSGSAFAVTIATQPTNPVTDLHAVGRDRHRGRRQRHLGDRQLQHRPARRRRHRHRPGRRAGWPWR